jgi:hypothetical protein
MVQVTLRSVASIALLLAAVVAGCATAPPVQEMSDARQAIAAAREAGAEELAPTGLAEAEALLDGAEDYLELGTSASYWQAKKAAISAKEVALEALLNSRDAQDAATGTTP